MARGALIAVGAILIAAGGAGLGFAVTRKAVSGMPPEMKDKAAGLVADIDREANTVKAAVLERARTLGSLLPVQAAVATDVDTAKDMKARGELAFSPEAGEVIELGSIPKKDGKASFADRQVFLVQPDTAKPSGKDLVLGASASWLENCDQGKPASCSTVVYTTAYEVTPKARADELAGYLLVSRTFDLAPSAQKLAAAGATARIGPHVDMPPAEWLEIPMTMSSGIACYVKVPPPRGGMPVPIAAAGGGVAFLGLILLVAGATRRGAAQPVPAQPIPSSGANAATQLTGGGGATTPTPGSLTAHNLGSGAMVGRWEIVKRLGSGGMADVFLARAKGDAGFEKLVALKVMHAHLARNERAVQHFLDEARLAARVVHPNVVQIQDLGKIGDDYVIVMEFVDGVDLERLLMSARAAGRQVPIAVALGIMCRICDGLNAAHRATAPDGTPLNIVHRDVKSANVLVSKQGAVKVVDFGIAKAAKQSHLTVAGETKGTPSMMAPEQRVGEVVDARADVYSAAAVAYEILTGSGVNLDLAALAHLGTDNWPHLPLPTQLRPDLPPALDPLLLTSMAFDRERRPADCAAFEAQLEAVMKQANLAASDKDIARWVATEIELLPQMPGEPAAAAAAT